MNYLVALILEKARSITSMICLMTGIFPRGDNEEELFIKWMSDNNYYALVRSLNENRDDFFLSFVTFNKN